ncbi:MAG: hypothetical protein AB1489_15160 [Acidobacteriota bacterium]
MTRPENLRLGLLALLITFLTACVQPTAQTSLPSAQETEDPIQAKIKDRADMLSRSVARQKELKAKVPEMPAIELFTRETNESQVLEKLGKPSRTIKTKMEKIEQHVLYYDNSKIAVWCWREQPDNGQFQYRATMSINHGKFDLPLHNVFTEEELKDVLNLAPEK